MDSRDDLWLPLFWCNVVGLHVNQTLMDSGLFLNPWIWGNISLSCCTVVRNSLTSFYEVDKESLWDPQTGPKWVCQLDWNMQKSLCAAVAFGTAVSSLCQTVADELVGWQMLQQNLALWMFHCLHFKQCNIFAILLQQGQHFVCVPRKQTPNNHHMPKFVANWQFDTMSSDCHKSCRANNTFCRPRAGVDSIHESMCHYVAPHEFRTPIQHFLATLDSSH